MAKYPAARTTLAILLTAALQTAIVTALEAVIAYFYFSTVPQPFERLSSDRGIPIYLILFAIAQLFLLVMVWDTVRQRNIIQLIGVVIFNLCIFGYAVFQYFQISRLEYLEILTLNKVKETQLDFETMKRNMRPLLIVIPCVTGTSHIVYMWLGYRLHSHFGWDVFKRIGANAKLRKMYRAYHIFVLLIKIDFFFFLGFALQFIILVLRNSSLELWLTVAAVPVTLAVLILAIYAVHAENRPIMCLFMVGLVASMVYFIYRLVRIYTVTNSERYLNAGKFLTFFAAVSLVAIVLTFIQSVICYRNFDQGLKCHLRGGKAVELDRPNYPPTRMTLEG
ncbi:hypothetical protein IWQ61_007599 [Dispira simplex]|nr:hypothetical protein IWQ61_007599 [Dispira simplex]